MFKNYFKIALRNLQRNKVYSFINIAGLALGLACAMLIILYIKDEVSYDRFQKDLPNIYRVVTENSRPDGIGKQKDGNTGYVQGPRFSQNVPGIKTFVRVQSGNEDIKNGAEIQSQELLNVDSNFFSVFSFPLLSGDAATCLSQPHSVVLSEDAAEKYFGSTNAVGKVVLVKKEGVFVPYSVTAVSKKCPQNSSIKFEALMPFSYSLKDVENDENWFNFFLNTFVVLDPNVNVKHVENGMQMFYEKDSKIVRKQFAEQFGDMGNSKYLLQPMADMHLSKDLPPQNGLVDASNPMYSYILSGIALFILLIACINFVYLTVARSLKRAKEIGIRKVVGGTRKQLISQFMGESVFLCFIAFATALLLVKLLLPLFNDLSNKALSLSYLFDAKLIAGYIILFVLTTLLAGFYPALVLSGYSPVQTLYSRFNLSGKNYLQKGLVVFQFALASFLIIGTVIIYSQFNFLTTTKLGYDDSNVVLVNKYPYKRIEALLFKNELLKNPNIKEVSFKNSGGWSTAAKVNGDSIINFDYETVDESFLKIMKIPLIAGRSFSPDFPSDSTSSVMVNESFVKKAGWQNPLGRMVDFWWGNEKYTVIGIVKDYHFQSLNEKIGPQLFTISNKNDYGQAFIKIKEGSNTSSLKHIQATFKKLFPISPYSYQFKDLENLKSYESEAKWKQIMMFGALITIFISCIGLFGLSVLSAEKRTKEIGIRKVLGASVSSVVSALSKDFLKLVFISMIIAIPIAWWASAKWLDNYPYRITLSWWMFVLAGVLVLMVALATVIFHALKAAMANPVESLRSE
ncbi:MAG: ABC transporter permease [Ginsengibacter sp.]